jgi:hypothetical protein
MSDLDIIEGMEAEMGYDDDESGYEELGYDEMGARVVRSRRTGRISTRAPTTRTKLASPPAASTAPAGAGNVYLKRVPLGLGSFRFTAATATTNRFIVEPQRDFQPERIIIETTKGGGATANVRVTSIKVGDSEQMPAGLGMPSPAFRADAVDAYLDLTLCKGGIELMVECALSAALAGVETIDVDVGIYGRVVGQ